jgi:hypothetical protein
MLYLSKVNSLLSNLKPLFLKKGVKEMKLIKVEKKEGRDAEAFFKMKFPNIKLQLSK